MPEHRMYPVDAFERSTPADETVFFGLGKREYAVNLSEENAADLRAKLDPFINAARKVGHVSIGDLRLNLVDHLVNNVSPEYAQWPYTDQPLSIFPEEVLRNG